MANLRAEAGAQHRHVFVEQQGAVEVHAQDEPALYRALLRRRVPDSATLSGYCGGDEKPPHAHVSVG